MKKFLRSVLRISIMLLFVFLVLIIIPVISMFGFVAVALGVLSDYPSLQLTLRGLIMCAMAFGLFLFCYWLTKKPIFNSVHKNNKEVCDERIKRNSG